MHYCESCPDPTLMEPASGAAVRPTCGREEAAPTQPFLVVTGASGSGKSTLLNPLAQELAGEAAVFDIDSLIAPFSMQADGVGVNWAAVRAAWLSVAHGLAAGGLPTVLLGPLAPFHLQDLRQTRWVRSLYFFLLDCPDAIRRERLEARPPWRGRQRERDIEEQTQWGAWLREHIHDWEPRLAGIQQSLRSGWDAPPLIVDACKTAALLVSDGNHRFEAQRQMGRDTVWALLFFDDAEAWQSFARPWAIDAPRQAGAGAAL